MFTTRLAFRTFLLLSCFVLLTAVIISCEKDQDDALASFDCSDTSPTYNNDIAPLLNSLCATSNCHSSSAQSGGIDLSNFMAAQSESFNARFLGAINHLSSYEPMPKDGGKLDDEDIKLLTCWVDNGSPE